MTTDDEKWMDHALELARQGDPSPNPHVGCVITDGTKAIAEAFHATAGLEHAETQALAAAGQNARGKTMYVTLEPCNHQGRTAPCVDAILAAGIKRVVIATRDPNPNVQGGGIERLQQSGVEVVVGVREEAAKDQLLPWTKFITRGQAYLSLKLALSLDGRIATRTGASKWITGEQSRARVHQLRTLHDAVMIGISTVITDDPLLTVRDIAGRNPVRLIVDSKLRLPLQSRIVATAKDIPTCAITTDAASHDLSDALEAAGLSVIRLPATAEGRCDLTRLLPALATREVVSVLCEGGAELAGSMLAAHLVDELHAFIAPVLLGPRGRPGAVDWAGPESPTEAPRISKPKWELCGDDAYVRGRLTYPKRST